jgi:hypothetical protein
MLNLIIIHLNFLSGNAPEASIPHGVMIRLMWVGRASMGILIFWRLPSGRFPAHLQGFPRVMLIEAAALPRIYSYVI